MSKVVKAVSNAVSGVVKAVGSVVSGVVNAVSSVVSAVVNFVVTPFLGLFGLGSPDVPDTSTESIKGVLVQHTGSDVRIPVVYGYRKVAGTVVFAETGSDSNKYLWVAYVFSEGQVEGLREVWIDNTQLPSVNISKLNNGERVTVSGTDAKGAACKFNGLTQLQFYKGILTNNPTETNVGNVVKAGIFAGSPSFANTMNYNGLVTVFARYEWPTDTTNNPFGGSIPKLEICLLGRKVASLTSGNPENYAWGDFSNGYTEAYSTNPAEILLDYLRNPFYGKGLYNADIDWDSFKTVAAKCNQQVEYIQGVSGPIHTLNYVVDTGSSIFSNCKNMLSNFRSYLPYSNGKYKLVIEDAGDPTDILSGVTPVVATFTKDNLVGEITYTGIERSSKYNTVVVNYVDPDNQWSPQSVTYPETQEERLAYIADDGGREFKGEFTFNGITNYAMAKDMARLTFMKSRYQDSLSLTVSSQGFELEPGDSIYLDSTILKFGTEPTAGAIPWRIVSAKLNNNYTFSLGCVRNPDFIYPHVRVGEIDYKYAVYVPKGASRYYPQEPFGVPVGLKPPTYAPTDPADPNNPPVSPGAGILVDTVDFNASSASLSGSTVVLTLGFLQPSNPSYSSLKVRYKENTASATTWTELDISTKPGASKQVTFNITNLLNNKSYILETQVAYLDGSLSTKYIRTTVTINVPVPATPTAPAPVVPPPITPPPAPTPPANPAADFLAYAFGRTVIDGSTNPLPVRTVNFTLRQDVRAGTNSYLSALEIYKKPSGETGWTKTVKTLTNTQGADITFAVECGPRVYPLIPGSGGVPESIDDYDFIFRFIYSDGKTSKYQYRAMGCSIEYGAYGHDVYVLDPGAAGGTIYAKELTTDYTPALASAATVVDKRDMADSMSAYQFFVTQDAGVNVGYFWASPPPVAASPYFLGWRVHTRQVIVGTTTTDNPIKSDDDNKPYLSSTDIFFNGSYTTAVGCKFKNLLWDVEVEYIAVPLVWYNGAITTATKAFYWKGKVHNRSSETGGNNPYPISGGNIGNWFSRYTPQLVNYQTALNSLSAPYPDIDPIAKIKTATRVGQSTDMRGYWNITFQVPNSMTSFKIYRRSVHDNRQPVGFDYNYFDPVTLADAGRWEYLVPTTGQYTKDANNIVTINLRPAISGRCEFNFYDFDPTKPKSTSNYLYKGYTNTEPTVKQLVGEGFGSPTEIMQVMIIITTSSGQSNQAVLLDLRDAVTFDPTRDMQTVVWTGLDPSKSNLISPIPVPAPDSTNLNTMKRSLGESRIFVSAANIKCRAVAYVTPTATPGVL